MENSSFSHQFQLSGVYAPLDSSGVVKIPQNPTVNQFNTYCSNMLEYMSTCIQGPDIIKYCNTPGLYCIDNHSPYLLNGVEVQCNATTIDLCPERHYCPDARTMIECPKGHFCREGVTKPRPCVFYSLACPDEKMANPMTYTIAIILLTMFVLFILFYEFFIYRRVKSQEMQFKKATEFKTMQALEQEAISPLAGVIVSQGNYIPHPSYPPCSPDSMGTLGTHNTGESTSSMVFSKLGGSWDGRGLIKGERNIGGKCGESEAGGEEESDSEEEGGDQRGHNSQRQGTLKRNTRLRRRGIATASEVLTSQDSGYQPPCMRERIFNAVSRSFKMSQENILPCRSKGNEFGKEDVSGSKGGTAENGCMGHGAGKGTGMASGSGAGFSAVLGRASDFRFNTVVDPIDVDFNGLNLTLKSTGKKVLRNLCGSLKAGHITAIIGPSGAGKTSLLSLLRGQSYYAKIGGVLRVNRVPVTSLQRFRDRVAYVPQEDILYDDLTVEENVLYSALLFNRRGLIRTVDLYPLVNHALELLGIKFICNSVVGNIDRKGISGGQRRRVSVAMEMMKEADMFLLDEPTSGLDSGTSISLMNCLHSLSSLGTNIVATLHQPRNEIFNLVDHLILLAPGGRIAYTGDPAILSSHFHSLSFTCPLKTNIADFVMDVMSGFVCMKGEQELHPVEVILAYLCEW
jgi:ABC-type multidrug transport system ATPase subunit